MTEFTQQQPADAQSEFNAMTFLVQQMLSRINTVKLVEVMSVGAGVVNVRPLVNMTAGDGSAVLHDVIHNVPFFRLQGGGNAIVIDPVVGDIGMCGFCDRDSSTVKTTKKQANPASGRMFDYSDGLYFGGMLNAVPVRTIQFDSGGITITASTINLVGTVKHNGHVVDSTHTHGGVQTGSGTSGMVNS